MPPANSIGYVIYSLGTSDLYMIKCHDLPRLKHIAYIGNDRLQLRACAIDGEYDTVSFYAVNICFKYYVPSFLNKRQFVGVYYFGVEHC